MSTHIVWFRDDLRIHDNPPLVGATQQADEILPVYILDDRKIGEGMFEIDKISGYRAKFVAESVNELRDSLKSIGGNLMIRRGEVEEVLTELEQNFNVKKIHFQTKPGTEEVRREEKVKQAVESDCERYWSHTLYHINDLPTDYRNINDTFTPWRKGVQYNAEVRDTYQRPEQLSVPKDADFGEKLSSTDFGCNFETPSERGFIQHEGGENSAMNRVEEYIWEKDKLREYKETRNGLLGKDYSSKFSAWLSSGCLSPRYVYEEVKRYEDERVSNDSTYWLIFELMWRDFFQFQFIKYGKEFFLPTGIRDVDRDWRTDRDDFDRWKKGETGFPFVDANMREINQTGYMSNRGRQNVASFLVDVLDIDWRMGAAYFEKQLVDYDVASNWGNWAYIAGVGNDSRDDRYFNTIKQGKKYDSNAEYIRHWIPEFENVPADATHEPWEMNKGLQATYGMELGIDYPRPIVDIQNNSYREIVRNSLY
jgi:deoxyribodipyrimidine photo-lyase